MSTIGKTKCGKFVFDRYGSHVDVPSGIIKEALANLKIQKDTKSVYTSVRLSSRVGYSVVVPTKPMDDVFYAKRQGTSFLSRFVKKDPIPTRYVSLELRQLDKIDNEWVLISSHFGETRHPEIDFSEGIGPMDEDLTYWNFHAFCWGYLSVVPGTITEVCPWEP